MGENDRERAVRRDGAEAPGRPKLRWRPDWLLGGAFRYWQAGGASRAAAKRVKRP